MTVEQDWFVSHEFYAKFTAERHTEILRKYFELKAIYTACLSVGTSTDNRPETKT